MWIRPIEKNDIPAIAAIEKICFTDPWNESMLTDMVNNNFDETFVLEDAAHHAASDTSTATIKSADGKASDIIGYVNIRTLADESELMRICIIPEKRGYGFSKLIMERAIIAAKVKKAEKVFLEVRESNEAAISLYSRYNFKEISKRPDYYSNPTEAAVVMQLTLPS